MSRWIRDYDRTTLSGDIVAALIVTIMLIPQSLAYALLAGLPPEAGIYASIVPVLLYTVFATSRALAVGPVAIVSLMTASSLGQIAEQGSIGYVTAALSLAFISGLILLVFGVLRLGFLANFLSHPVIAGFISASCLLIAFGQLKYILGVEGGGNTLPEIVLSLLQQLSQINVWTVTIGGAVFAFLFWSRKGLKSLACGLGASDPFAAMIARASPILAVGFSTVLVSALHLDLRGVAIVGEVPNSFPPFTIPSLSAGLISQLFVPAVMISVIGLVESISIAQTLAAQTRDRIDPDQELIGLGVANIGAAFTGGYPVTGGFARSVVNADAGARTPAAGAFAAFGLLAAALTLTPLVHNLPSATLAATIIVAVLRLIDFSILRKTWLYARSDFAAVSLTILVTLVLGIETGVAVGVGVSILLHLLKTSRPHVAVVGRVPHSEHFRNVMRHRVEIDSAVLALRVDESLYFVNARFLEDFVRREVANREGLRDVILVCSAINEIDYSALECLEAINAHLASLGVGFHLSEVKGPVMDKLAGSHFVSQLNGRIFLSQGQAWRALAKHARLSGGPEKHLPVDSDRSAGRSSRRSEPARPV